MATFFKNLFSKPKEEAQPFQHKLEKEREDSIAFSELSYSENELNKGFIADDSRNFFSDTQSSQSEEPSVSSVSAISRIRSPPLRSNAFSLEAGLGLKQWPQEDHNLRFPKRRAPDLSDDNGEDFTNIGGCTKKILLESNRVATYEAHSESSKQLPSEIPQNFIKSRRTKVESGDSSAEDIRNIIQELDTSKRKTVMVRNKLAAKSRALQDSK